MADQYTLEAQPRAVLGKQVKALRRQDMIPAVIYGQGAPMNISCPRRPLEIVLQKASSTHIVNITIDGQTHNTLVREVQRHKIRRDIMHVDFLRVDLSRVIRTEVQLTTVNPPKLGSELMLLHDLMQIEVECLPTNIPDHIEVDVSALTHMGDRITVGNLKPLPDVKYLTEPEAVIARVELISAQPDEEVAGETTASEPELVERRKKAEDEEED